MISFKQMLNLHEAKNKHPDGTYISAHLDKNTSDQLAKFTDSLNLANPAPPSQYHSTITYSRKGIPEAENHIFKTPIEGVFKEWKLFDNRIQGTKCLVAIVDSSDLNNYHKQMKKLGASHDFPDYHAHVTLTYDYEHDEVPTTSPKFKFTYDKVVVKPLDPTFIPSKDKPES